MNIAQAIITANYFVDCFESACDRIEIVGSTKRQDKDEVHDIEILMILNGKHPRPVFGVKETPPSMLDATIAELKAANILRDPQRKANGEKYKKFAIVEHSAVNDFCLDLFIVTPQTWGLQNVIRTGPSLFSHSFVTNCSVIFWDKETCWKYRGLLPNQYQYIAGKTKIMSEGAELSLPEEADAINLLGRGWIEPKNRRQLITKA